ncbi:hypothetical protein SYNGFB01_08060 [Synechococcus sp. GFB01]|nr:hypothetical protein SYNGFB01_08060 [Synechococcus sp. GFB01]
MQAGSPFPILRASGRGLRPIGPPATSGFTLVEVLAASVVLVISLAGALVAFNLISQSVQGTGIRADQNRLIDQDIARISDLSERFTSCANPQGSVPATACTGTNVQTGNSFYYHPAVGNPNDASTWTDANTFATACTSGTLRDNFITVIGGQQDLAGNVRRLATQAVAGSTKLVRLTWVDQSNGNRVLRQLDTAPVVAGFCP